MPLLRRDSSVSRVATDLDLQPGSSYTVTVLEPGAICRSASLTGLGGTLVPVYPGHGLALGDIVIKNIDPNAFGIVTATTTNTVTVGGSFPCDLGDVILNLGADTGSSGPAYDGSPIPIYSTPDTTTQIVESRVAVSEEGEYGYWHDGSASWELLRDEEGNPIDIVLDVNVASESAIGGWGVNVKDFGALGDGVADDTNAILAAIATRSTLAGSIVGGVILFPAGNYIVSAPIPMTSGIILRGESTQASRITAANSFVGSNILLWDGVSGLGQNPGVGARDLYLNCNGVSATGIQVYKGYDGVHFDNVMVDNIGFANNGWRFEQDPDYGNVVSQTILLSNCYGIHTSAAGAGATGSVFYFNGVQESTLVNCKGFGGYAVATGACNVFEFDGCRGVTMLGGAAAISSENGIKIKGTARASQGLSFYGVTFEAVADTIDAEGNVFVVSNINVHGSRTQEGAVVPAQTTGGFRLTNVTFGNFEANHSIPMIVGANCNRINYHTELYTNLTSDAGDGTKLIADNHSQTGNEYSVFGQGITIAVPSANTTGPEIHWAHNAVADYYRMFWSRSSSVDNGFQLRYVNASGTPFNVIAVDGSAGNFHLYRGGIEKLSLDANGANVTGNLNISANVRRSVSAAITASISQVQGGSALTADINNVSVCANAGDNVTLPTAAAGMVITIMNNGAQALRIFPASSDNLGNGVNNARAVDLAAGSNIVYAAYDAVNWEEV